jgi:hypothetical protein
VNEAAIADDTVIAGLIGTSVNGEKADKSPVGDQCYECKGTRAMSVSFDTH